MNLPRPGSHWAIMAFAALLSLSAHVDLAEAARKTSPLSPSQATEIRRALDESRLLDAGQLIDRATMAGADDLRLKLLTGELGLARGRYSVALQNFRAAEAAAELRGEALQGQGLALLAMGRNVEAAPLLEKAVAASPAAWRAWNALGSHYDTIRDWPRATEAYERALTNSTQPAIVLNNRGYSQLLQGRLDKATSDFVLALETKPDFTQARTNLRLALALRGEYDRALSGAKQEEASSLLNNAGFAAGVRGDYAKARDLLQNAIESRGEYYSRASENMKLFKSISDQDPNAK